MYFDIIFLLVLGFSIYKGIKDGFILSVFSFITLFIGMIGAFKFAHITALYLDELLQIKSKYIPIISFLITFLLIVIIVKIISKLLDKLLSKIHLGLWNKIVGTVFWAFLFLFLYSTSIWILERLDLVSYEAKSDSKTYDFIKLILPYTFQFIGKIFPIVYTVFEDIQKYFEQFQNIEASIVNDK